MTVLIHLHEGIGGFDMSVASDLVPMYSRGPAAGGGEGGRTAGAPRPRVPLRNGRCGGASRGGPGAPLTQPKHVRAHRGSE